MFIVPVAPAQSHGGGGRRGGCLLAGLFTTVSLSLGAWILAKEKWLATAHVLLDLEEGVLVVSRGHHPAGGYNACRCIYWPWRCRVCR